MKSASVPESGKPTDAIIPNGPDGKEAEHGVYWIVHDKV